MDAMKWVIAAVVLVMLVLLISRLAQKRSVIVLGQELANARERDERVRRNAGRSPLPPRSYSTREKSLVHPEEVPLDTELRAVAQRFANADDTTRRKMQMAISTDEFYDLMTFALREAVFAMRDRKCEHIATGLAATAMVDVNRIDHRDASMTLAPLHYAGRRCGIDPAPLLKNAAGMSTREMREVIDNFAARPEAGKALEKWLLHDVGTGFVARMIARYEPTRDLTTAAVRVHDLLNADRYPGSDVSIADDFSDHWFPGAKDAYGRIRAGAVLHGRDETEGDEMQSIMVFLAETAHAADAEALRAALRVGEGRASLAVARGNLVAIMIGQAFLGNQRTLETNESLARFAEPLAKILEETR